MRRKDREITDRARIEEILRECRVIRIGLRDGDEVYIVPMNFGWENRDGRDRFYMHCATEGRKLTLIRRDPRAGFEMDAGFSVYGKDTACSHATSFRSVIGNGTVSILTDTAEIRRALDILMYHQTGKDGWVYEPDMLDRITVLSLEADSLSVKEHL